jgi:hypothetical protein
MVDIGQPPRVDTVDTGQLTEERMVDTGQPPAGNTMDTGKLSGKRVMDTEQPQGWTQWTLNSCQRREWWTLDSLKG